MKKTIPLLCLLLAVFPFTVHSDDAKARQLLKQANEAAEKYSSFKGTYEETIRLYKAAIAESNEDPAICVEFVKKSLYLLKFSDREKHLENAVTYYRKAAAKGFNDIEIMQNIGYSYYNTAEGFTWIRESMDLAEKKMNEAHKAGHAGAAAQCRKNVFAGYDLMAMIYNDEGAFNKSLDLLSLITKKFPEARQGEHLCNFAVSHHWLAMKALGDGNYSAAGKHLAATEDLITRAGKTPRMGYTDVPYFKRMLRECTALNGKKPAYTQKILVLYVCKARLRRNIPQTIPVNQFEGVIKEKLSKYEFGLIKGCYILNSQKNAFELSKKGLEELNAVGDGGEQVSRILGGIGFPPPAKDEYYPEQTISDTQLQFIKIYVNLLARKIEAMTNGNLSLQFTHAVLKDATITGTYPAGFGGADYCCRPNFYGIEPYPSEFMFNILPEHDVVFFYTPDKISPHVGFWPQGGSHNFPIIPYVVNAPKRAKILMRPGHHGNESDKTLIHEYFHIVENIWDISPYHGFEHPGAFPGYKPPKDSEEHFELAYYRWHFATTIPRMIEEMRAKGDKSGWTRFNFTQKYPMRLSKEAFANLLKKSKGVSLEDRRDAQDCMARAKLAREKKNNELADQLYRQALKLNPACFDAYYHIGDRALEEKNYREAVENYAEYLKYADSPKYISKTGCILITSLDDYKQGMKYADMAIESDDEIKNKVRWCRETGNALWAMKRYGDAARYYERGASLNYGRDSLECLFFKGEALYADGDRDKGKSVMQSAYEKGLKGIKKYDDKMKKYK